MKKQVGWSMLLIHLLYLLVPNSNTIGKARNKRQKDQKTGQQTLLTDKQERTPAANVLNYYAVETKTAMFKNSFFPQRQS